MVRVCRMKGPVQYQKVSELQTMSPAGIFPTALDLIESWVYKGCALNVAK